MAWKKILNFPNTGSGTFLLAFAFVLFFSFFLGIHNTFAVSDYTETITTTSGDFFINCNLSCIQQYRYLILDWTPVISNNFIPITANFSRDGLTKNSPIYLNSWASSHVIIDISGISSAFIWDRTPPPGLNLVATLTESYSSCPEPEPCSVIPENPYDDKFDKIIVAIYTCGAILLTIYFFYCIYGMIIKSTGGK